MIRSLATMLLVSAAAFQPTVAETASNAKHFPSAVIAAPGPREQSVLDALKAYEKAILATNVADAQNQRDITVRVYGDNAVVQQIFTLHGTFGGRETNTEVRCTFVWIWRGGRWQMVANQLTAVAP